MRSVEEEMRRLRKEKKLTSIIALPMFASIIHSVFLPLKLGTSWFYAGLPICFLGLVMILIAVSNFATTPIDEPVTKGVYQISRSSMYFFGILTYIGAGIACASWIFLLLTMVIIILIHHSVVYKERWCLEKYGDTYREYLNRTPRWIGIPKSRKK